jgi:methanogenic corrinoid protein MtbC1
MPLVRRHPRLERKAPTTMHLESTIEQLFHLVASGDRRRARTFVADLLGRGVRPERLANDVFWPVHEMLVKLFKHAQISRLSYNYATRTLRQLADQGALAYVRAERPAGRVLLMCGPTEGEELGAQLAVDLLEAAGYEVFFGGAGVSNDEVIGELARTKPAALVMWASAAADAPAIRGLIDQLREIGGHPNLRILCGGGVFNRAEGLAQEIGAHATASTPAALVAALNAPTDPTPAVATQPSVRRLRQAA